MLNIFINIILFTLIIKSTCETINKAIDISFYLDTSVTSVKETNETLNASTRIMEFSDKYIKPPIVIVYEAK